MNNRRFTVNKPLDLKSLSSSQKTNSNPESPKSLSSENEAEGEE